jgi:hypothetical protein
MKSELPKRYRDELGEFEEFVLSAKTTSDHLLQAVRDKIEEHNLNCAEGAFYVRENDTLSMRINKR